MTELELRMTESQPQEAVAEYLVRVAEECFMKWWMERNGGLCE